jgi:hypothetical protein
MNYYSFDTEDHAKSSWALHEVLKLLPNRPDAEGLPSVLRKFFPSADVEVRMKPQYRPPCCRRCGRFDSDTMFGIGFDDPVMIRFKGDFGFTNDRVFVISDKFLKALRTARTSGYETKPLGKSGWHALRATRLVDHVEGVIKSRKPLCPECGRPKESYGLFEHLRGLSLPTQPNTLFSTKQGWPSWHSSDRQLFITEDALHLLKASGIAGGYCSRLWTDEELAKHKQKAKEGAGYWIPPGALVRLNGKRSAK